MDTGSNRKEEATDYANLGSLFEALGEHSQTKEYNNNNNLIFIFRKIHVNTCMIKSRQSTWDEKGNW